jgi:hypothetical protein
MGSREKLISVRKYFMFSHERPDGVVGYHVSGAAYELRDAV